MQLVAAYIAVVLIWSTTPLGIVWSSTSVSPSMALLLRMSIALVLGWTIVKLARIDLPWTKQARRFYICSALGVSVGMLFTYIASRSIPSGVISLVFGLSPILSGLFAQKILGEKKFNTSRKWALVLSFLGLVIVCAGKLSGESGAKSIYWLDLVLIFMAVGLFSLSAVLVKQVKIQLHPLASTVGTLIVSMPIFILGWWVLDGNWPISNIQPKSIWSIIYLGVAGSLLGFVAYFYILQRLSASTVSLVTLMTPVLAIFLGSKLNGEVITSSLLVGTVFIMFGLVLYFFGYRLVWPFTNKLLK
ncbi:MAG: EamA family transporter [Paraglaciecola sp.]|uniref:DMT family transporter n=1 Tax=Paraglaciecola sp. TaxID=1920173 RepID=UPI003296A8E2